MIAASDYRQIVELGEEINRLKSELHASPIDDGVSSDWARWWRDSLLGLLVTKS
jgi:hypothetical protein